MRAVRPAGRSASVTPRPTRPGRWRTRPGGSRTGRRRRPAARAGPPRSTRTTAPMPSPSSSNRCTAVGAPRISATVPCSPVRSMSSGISVPSASATAVGHGGCPGTYRTGGAAGAAAVGMGAARGFGGLRRRLRFRLNTPTLRPRGAAVHPAAVRPGRTARLTRPAAGRTGRRPAVRLCGAAPAARSQPQPFPIERDRRLQPLGQTHLRLPAQQPLRLGDVRAALLGVVDGEG